MANLEQPGIEAPGLFLHEIAAYYDSFTGRHIGSTREYIRIMVERLIKDNVYADELLIWDMNVALLSSQLHDVGKAAVNGAILNKPGKLTREEFEIIKTHVRKGVEAIERIGLSGRFHVFLKQARLFAGAHHEKWDGSGYPDGLEGRLIPLEGRIMAIADVYDALTTARPYKSAFTAEESAEIIIGGAGVHFDPALINAFYKSMDDFATVSMAYSGVV